MINAFFMTSQLPSLKTFSLVASALYDPRVRKEEMQELLPKDLLEKIHRIQRSWELYLQFKPYVDSGKEGETALVCAAVGNSSEIAGLALHSFPSFFRKTLPDPFPEEKGESPFLYSFHPKWLPESQKILTLDPSGKREDLDTHLIKWAQAINANRGRELALHLAVSLGHPEIVSELFQAVSLFPIASDGLYGFSATLAWAILSHQEETLSLILRCPNAAFISDEKLTESLWRALYIRFPQGALALLSSPVSDRLLLEGRCGLLCSLSLAIAMDEADVVAGILRLPQAGSVAVGEWLLRAACLSHPDTASALFFAPQTQGVSSHELEMAFWIAAAQGLDSVVALILARQEEKQILASIESGLGGALQCSLELSSAELVGKLLDLPQAASLPEEGRWGLGEALCRAADALCDAPTIDAFLRSSQASRIPDERLGEALFRSLNTPVHDLACSLICASQVSRIPLSGRYGWERLYELAREKDPQLAEKMASMQNRLTNG